ncbi:MAG TPA: hypothetical protein K8W18_00510, partial [Corynebacterium glutamicum]|nr:hypothetical protein [Corynebacterium glutamicum]
MKTPRLLKILSAMVAVTGLLIPTVVPMAAADAAELSDNVPDRTQIAIINPDGSVQESDNAEESRPALSLAKLYLGYYVLAQGT